MFKSIKTKFVIIYILLITIVMFSSGTMIIVMVNKSEQEFLKKELEEAVEVIEQDLELDFTEEEIRDYLITRIKNYKVLSSDKNIYLFNADGEVVFPTGTTVPLAIKNKPQVMAALSGHGIAQLDNVKLNDAKHNYIGYAKGIKQEEHVKYAVYVLASLEEIDMKTRNIIQIILMAVISAIFISVAFGYFFAGFLSKPIVDLTEKAKEMADGELEDMMKVSSEDEIGQLTQSFNDMAMSLNDTLNQISSEKNKLEFMFSQITDGIVVFDNIGGLTHTNPASIDMLDIDEKVSFDEIFYNFIHEPFKDIAKEVLQGPVTNVIKKRERYFNISLAKFSSKKETFLGVICVVQDITEHKKLELMQKEFVANVSHELRTPLTTIKSYTETLLDGAMEQPEIADNFLNVINNESDRMTALVKDLLELSRLDNKQTNFDMKDIDIHHVLKDSIEKLRIHTVKKEQELVLYEAEVAHMIFGDANRLEQVIKNLVSNAVKYSPKGAKIEVSEYIDGEHVIIEVKDNGFGIPKEDIDRIFERFYRVNKERSREMGGTGLGLAIAKEIVEYHGGEIAVESEFDKGTTFFLKFPLLKK